MTAEHREKTLSAKVKGAVVASLVSEKVGGVSEEPKKKVPVNRWQNKCATLTDPERGEEKK